jgi:HAE1 family hydrophobic/amphiphilic exporter-1
MRGFITFCVRRPVLVLMVFAAATLFGVYSATKLPLDMLPKVEPPVISVVTIYPGAGAEDVETKVTDPVERSLSSISGLEKLTSSSKENISMVTLQFEFGVDLEAAANEVRQFLDLLKRNLPSDAQQPWVFKFNTSMLPTFILGVKANRGDLRAYRELVKDKLVSRIEAIDGVASTMMLNAPERQVRVDVDRKKLQDRDLSLFGLIRVLTAQNLTVPAGRMKTADLDLPVTVPGDYRSLDQIRSTLVGMGSARPLAGAYRPDVPDPFYLALGQVYLRDVANVTIGMPDRQSVAKFGDKETMWIMVFRKSGANTIQVVDRINRSIASFQKHLPAGLELVPLLDGSELIRSTVDNLTESVYMGGLWVILVVFIFLRHLRPSLVVAATIPASMIAVFLGMYLRGFTINAVSLMAMALTIGMVVDNAIVVLESIIRRVDAGEPPREAAVNGTAEVAVAITASTLTTVVIFAPLVFVRGFIGVFLGQLGFVAVFTLTASLVTALTVTPTLAALLIKPTVKQSVGWLARLGRWGEARFQGFERAYGRVLGFSVRHWLLVLVVALGGLGGSAFLVLRTGVDFVLNDDFGFVQLTMEMPEGTRLERTTEAADAITAELRRYPEVKMTFFNAGTTEGSMLALIGGKEGSNVANIYAKLVPKEKRKASELDVVDRIRPFIQKRWPKALLGFKTGNPMGAAVMGAEKPITLYVKGKDFNHLKQAARQLEAMVKAVPGTKDVAAELLETKPDFRITVDRARAAKMGLSSMAIGGTLRAALHGWKVTEYRAGTTPMDIIVRLRPEDRQRPEDLEQLLIPNLMEKHVTLGDQVMHGGMMSFPLGNFARIVRGQSPIEIRHQNKERVVRVTGGYRGRALGDVAADVDRGLARLSLPKGVTVEQGAEVEQQKRTLNDLLLVLAFSIILVYMVMAAQYESFLDPFVIMFSIPFTLTGVFLTFLITGEKLSLPAFVGLIVLVGVVVNNAIVLVDYVTQLRDEGWEMGQAIQAAGERRLRPVLMTAVTTIAGMVPLALTTKEGAFVWSPLGKAVVGGLAVSTLVTLLLVPVLYARFEPLRRRYRRT